MRTYKSIEKPARVLGMNLLDLGLMIGLFIGSVLVLGFLNLLMAVPRFVYVLLFLLESGGLLVMRYLTKTRPPGFLLGWISYRFVQPRRLAVGREPLVRIKNENRKNSTL